jgi:hypothetical protein
MWLHVSYPSLSLRNNDIIASTGITVKQKVRQVNSRGRGRLMAANRWKEYLFDIPSTHLTQYSKLYTPGYDPNSLSIAFLISLTDFPCS